MNVPADDAHLRAVRGVVEELAAPLIEQGSAKISVVREAAVGHSWFAVQLSPASPLAAGVRITAYPAQIDLAVGRYLVAYELCESSEEKRLHELRLHIDAVLAGRYEEQWEQVQRRVFIVPRRFTRLIGRFHTREGTRTYTYYSSPSARSEVVSYAAYGG